MNRRSLLLGSLSLTAAAAGLAACSPGETAGGSGGSGGQAAAEAPSYVPFPGVTPDGEATADGVMAMFKTFPAERPTYETSVPEGIEPVTILSQTDGAAPPVLAENRYWQELNKQLGTELDFNMVPLADLAAKQAVAIAGDDGPDLMQVKGRKSIPQMSQMLEAKFADLTDELSGDAISKYPGLANIPTNSWQAVMFNGRIMGVPQHTGAVGDILFTRGDVFDELGVSPEVSDENEFIELCKALTEPGKRWAFNSATTIYPYFRECLGVAFEWDTDDTGRLTYYAETEGARQALEFTARLWKEGYIHPDAFGGAGAYVEWFASGTTVMNRGGFRFADIVQNANAESNPELRVGMIKPFGFAGATPTKHLTNGTAGMTAIKKGSPERVQELLSVLNFLSPPFGTEQSLLRNYGVEGEQFDFVDGEPVVNEKGAAELRLPLSYTARPPQVLYSPGRPESAQEQYDYQVATVPTGVLNAVDSLSSQTDERTGTAISRVLNDVRDSVIQGRATLADWDEAVENWRKSGGDKIREEYTADRDANQ